MHVLLSISITKSSIHYSQVSEVVEYDEQLGTMVYGTHSPFYRYPFSHSMHCIWSMSENGVVS